MQRAWFVWLLAACGARPTAGPVQPVHYTGPVIDVHAHMQLDPKQPPNTAALLELDRKANVTHSGFIVMARQGDVAATRAQNDQVIALTKATGGKLFPVASVHPMDGSDALDELTRLGGLGVKLIKLHPNTQKFDVAAPEVAAVVARGAELGLVFLFDGFSPFDANESGKFLMLAVTNPKARMIIAHIGGPRFAEMTMFAMVKQFEWWPKNVWFDLSATSHTFTGSPFADQLVWVTRQIGIERIVFGSDYPVDTPEHAVQDVERLGYTADELRAIFHDNAAQLLGLD